jgi:cytoskeleton protein RodZ
MSDQQHPTQHVTHHNTTDGGSARPVDPAAAAESARTVGAQLARLREAKGWSIDDVSARLKVAPHKLRALESGDFSHLPDTTFAIGVVRSYAKMLGADPAPFGDALRRSSGPIEPDLSMPASSGTGLPRGRVVMNLGGVPKRRPWLWGIALAAVLVAVVAVWRTGGDSGAGWLARLRAGVPADTPHGASAARGDTLASSDAAAAGTAVTADESASAAREASGSTLTALPRPAAIDQASSAVASSAATTAAALASAPSSSAIAASARPAGAEAAGASAPVTLEGQAAVTIKVSQDSWFSVRQRDGKQVFSGLLRAGDEKSVQGVAPFRVTVGNKAGIAAVELDGKPVSSAKYESAVGNVARFSLP